MIAFFFSPRFFIFVYSLMFRECKQCLIFMGETYPLHYKRYFQTSVWKFTSSRPLHVYLRQLFIPVNIYSFFFFFPAGNYWHETSNRKTFFLNFAKEHKFDPLLPDNWYLVPISAIRAHKVCCFLFFSLFFFFCLFSLIVFALKYYAAIR